MSTARTWLSRLFEGAYLLGWAALFVAPLAVNNALPPRVSFRERALSIGVAVCIVLLYQIVVLVLSWSYHGWRKRQKEREDQHARDR